MIECSLKELGTYRGLSKELDAAIDALQTGAWRSYPHGRTELLGQDVYVNRFAYETKEMTSADPFETHLRYLDIHLIVSGAERMELAPFETQQETERKDADDAILSVGSGTCSCDLSPDRALIAFPWEAHRPKGMLGTPCTVEKAVCKVRWTK